MLFHRGQFKMAPQDVVLVQKTASMVAFLLSLLCKMAPAVLLRCLSSGQGGSRLLSCSGACCLLSRDIVGSCRRVLPLRLGAALGRLRRLPCQAPHLFVVWEVWALRQGLPVNWGSVCRHSRCIDRD